jgi:hypothetical protein
VRRYKATNYLVQTNIQNSESGNDLQFSSGEVRQEAYNHVGVLGRGNSINQINGSSIPGEKEASANQSQSNLGVLLMDTNDLNQYHNTAAVKGNDLNPMIDQIDKNLALMIGVDDPIKLQLQAAEPQTEPIYSGQPIGLAEPSVRCTTLLCTEGTGPHLNRGGIPRQGIGWD